MAFKMTGWSAGQGTNSSFKKESRLSKAYRKTKEFLSDTDTARMKKGGKKTKYGTRGVQDLAVKKAKGNLKLSSQEKDLHSEYLVDKYADKHLGVKAGQQGTYAREKKSSMTYKKKK
tara:strand:+ start:300 stop:650 length:351 start_codon:yes stop_codon:yes gene_type:complete